jgi:pSer/pThr/pTyr-binding forkhead associated (FHA) protein
MAFVEYGGKRHPLPAGDMLVGSGADCHLRLEDPGIAPRHAVLSMAPDQSVAIRKYDGTVELEVNGVRLGPLPQPLLHGDKITLGTADLLFADERKSGSTQYIPALKLPSIPDTPKAGAPGKATVGTGGRLVCLTDGREYQVIGAALSLGRDAKADVVVTGGQISRRHAEIVATPRGYMLVDYSANGTWVNGERVQNQRLLARADIIRMGEEEFRFYADLAPAAPPPLQAAAPAAPPPPAPPPPAPSPLPPARTLPSPAPLPTASGRRNLALAATIASPSQPLWPLPVECAARQGLIAVDIGNGHALGDVDDLLVLLGVRSDGADLRPLFASRQIIDQARLAADADHPASSSQDLFERVRLQVHRVKPGRRGEDQPPAVWSELILVEVGALTTVLARQPDDPMPCIRVDPIGRNIGLGVNTGTRHRRDQADSSPNPHICRSSISS